MKRWTLTIVSILLMCWAYTFKPSNDPWLTWTMGLLAAAASGLLVPGRLDQVTKLWRLSDSGSLLPLRPQIDVAAHSVWILYCCGMEEPDRFVMSTRVILGALGIATLLLLLKDSRKRKANRFSFVVLAMAGTTLYAWVANPWWIRDEEVVWVLRIAAPLTSLSAVAAAWMQARENKLRGTTRGQSLLENVGKFSRHSGQTLYGLVKWLEKGPVDAVPLFVAGLLMIPERILIKQQLRERREQNGSA